MDPPKKYVKINGIMKLNPDYTKWKEAQNGGKPATTVAQPNVALPVVTNMDDYAALNDAVTATGGPEVPLSEATSATIAMMQEPEICVQAGMTPDNMVDELGAILNKYEVPMGLMNKLMMLSEFESLEFIIDDSGSMRLETDAIDPTTRKPISRWKEAQSVLKEMVELLAYVPFSQIDILFLNRTDHINLKRNGRDPRSFLTDAYRQIDQVFAREPSGTTPALERLQDSYVRGHGKRIARYFFGDGVPNGGSKAAKEITRILVSRQDPEGNPITFISCTNEDEDVEWMKDAEEVAPYCSESDDFRDESAEVLIDQGPALPYTKGFHLVCRLVAAMNPDDLDAMDESVPFTKQTLDNLLGIESNLESYQHYFQNFIQNQRKRVVKVDPSTGRQTASDQIRRDFNWEQFYQDFLQAPMSKQIPAVQDFKRQLASFSSSSTQTMSQSGSQSGSRSVKKNRLKFW